MFITWKLTYTGLKATWTVSSIILLVNMVHSIWDDIRPSFPTVLWTVTSAKSIGQGQICFRCNPFPTMVEKWRCIWVLPNRRNHSPSILGVQRPFALFISLCVTRWRWTRLLSWNAFQAMSHALSTRSWPLLQAAQITSMTSSGKLKWHVVRQLYGGVFWTYSIKEQRRRRRAFFGKR